MRAFVGIGPQGFEDRDPSGQGGSKMDRKENEISAPDSGSKPGAAPRSFRLRTRNEVELFSLEEVGQVILVLGDHDPLDHLPLFVAGLVSEVRHRHS